MNATYRHLLHPFALLPAETSATPVATVPAPRRISFHPPPPKYALRHQRQLRGWSQGRLAEMIGADPAMVSRWECGVRKPSPYYREQLCRLFETSADTLGLL